jgi:hypothetical protein
MYIFLSLQQLMNDGDDTSDESIESEWDDDEEEEDSESGWLFLAAKLTSLYYKQLPLNSN